MAKCSNCGVKISSADAFCTGCGQPRKPADTAGRVPSASAAGPVVSDGVSGTAANGAAGGTTTTPPLTATPPSAGWPAPEHLLDRDAPHAVYLGGRLHYERSHSLEEFDPLKNFRFFGELAIRFLLLWIVYLVGQIPLFIISAILTVASPSAGLVIGSLLEFAWSVTMACVFWLTKVPGQLSEWKYTVDDKGDAAPATLDHIAWSLERRDPPLDSIRVRRFSVPGQGHRYLLEVRQGIYCGLVSCFRNGQDLYVGWTYWVYLSPLRLLWTFICRMVAQLRSKGSALYVSVQVDRSKALRESLHAAARDGVEVATGRVAAHGQGTIGREVPVVDDEAAGSSWRPTVPSM